MIRRAAAPLCATLLAACATYNAEPLPTLPDNAAVTRGGVSARGAVLAHYTEARSVLGDDLRGKGIVAVDLWIRNGRSRPILLDKSQTRLVVANRGILDLTEQEKARKLMNKSVLGAGSWMAVASGPLLPVALAASVVQIRGVNREIREDYRAKAFPIDRAILPGRQTRGLLFFEVPRRYTKKAGPRDFRAVVVTREKGSGSLQKFEFGVPRSRVSDPITQGKPFWKYP